MQIIEKFSMNSKNLKNVMKIEFKLYIKKNWKNLLFEFQYLRMMRIQIISKNAKNFQKFKEFPKILKNSKNSQEFNEFSKLKEFLRI